MAQDALPSSERAATPALIREDNDDAASGSLAPYYTPPATCQILGLSNELLDDICQRIIDHELAKPLEEHSQFNNSPASSSNVKEQRRLPEPDHGLKALGRAITKAVLPFTACKQLYAVAKRLVLKRSKTQTLYARVIRDPDTTHFRPIRLTGSIAYHPLILRLTRTVHLQIGGPSDEDQERLHVTTRIELAEQVRKVLVRLPKLQEVQVDFDSDLAGRERELLETPIRYMYWGSELERRNVSVFLDEYRLG